MEEVPSFPRGGTFCDTTSIKHVFSSQEIGSMMELILLFPKSFFRYHIVALIFLNSLFTVLRKSLSCAPLLSGVHILVAPVSAICPTIISFLSE